MKAENKNYLDSYVTHAHSRYYICIGSWINVLQNAYALGPSIEVLNGLRLSEPRPAQRQHGIEDPKILPYTRVATRGHRQLPGFYDNLNCCLAGTDLNILQLLLLQYSL